MRSVIVILSCSFLTGCPPVTRLYLHNKSEDTLVYKSYRERVEPTKIKPGRTKWVPLRSDESSSCVELEVNGDVRYYEASLEARMTGQSTGYGSRIDAYYQYGRMFVQKSSGDWLEVESRDSCDAPDDPTRANRQTINGRANTARIEFGEKRMSIADSVGGQ